MDDAEMIFKKVAERKQRARDLDLDKMMCSLYFDHLRHYIAGMHHAHQRYAIISEAKEMGRGSIRLTMNSRDYVLAYEERTAYLSDDLYGDLKLLINGEIVFELSVSVDVDEYGTWYKPLDVTAFIEGDWVRDFQELERQVLQRRADWERNNKKQQAAELKKKFGLE